ncbi:MAG: hypothetical protein ABI047_03365 [Jatrophihabitantaceae bacterium]
MAAVRSDTLSSIACTPAVGLVTVTGEAEARTVVPVAGASCRTLLAAGQLIAGLRLGPVAGCPRRVPTTGMIVELAFSTLVWRTAGSGLRSGGVVARTVVAGSTVATSALAATAISRARPNRRFWPA